MDPQLAAKRALCLSLLVLRAQAESQLHREPRDGRGVDIVTPEQDFAVRHVHLLKQEGLWEAASVRERALFEKPLGSWQRQEIVDGSWRQEALGVLIWALGSSTDLPPYDHETNAMEMATASREAQPFIAHAKLRDFREIDKARDVAELWLWRARTTQLRDKQVTPPKGMTFEGIIAQAAKAGERDGLFTAIDDDFPALGRSYAKLSKTEWYTMHSIASERLCALNWLCGYSDDWDNVPLGT